MNEIYKADSPAWRVSDVGEHADALAEVVTRGDVVQYDNDQLDNTVVLLAMIEDDSDLVNKILTEMIIKNENDAKAFDAKLQELALEAARSYQGKYDAYSADEFIGGQRACVEGGLCPKGSSDDFKAGFGYQYELEQIAEHHPRLAKKIKQTKEILK